MNIKSLLFGSAAALAVVSGAHAADAIVAAEPEPAEYVKVCDAFGASGYFYIPGTETCLKIGGYVRFNVGFDSNTTASAEVEGKSLNARKWNATTKADLQATAKSETDFGELTGFIELNAESDEAATGGQFSVDSAYISLGGLQAGFYGNFFDFGVGEGSTWADKTKFNAISYTYGDESFKIGIGIDEIRETGNEKVIDSAYVPANGATPATNATFKTRTNNGIGLEAMTSATIGGVSTRLVGVYDTDTNNGAIKGRIVAPVGPGNLGIAAVWSSGENVYTGLNDFDGATLTGTNGTGKITKVGGAWAVGAAYEYKISDKLKFAPEFQIGQTLKNSDGNVGKAWMVGALTTYDMGGGLAASVDVNYFNTTTADKKDDHYVSGYFRLQRSF